ncbi:MAG: TetR/AcrR family transcriptional regulator, partial [Sneathiella sp.]|nr:TetR/AcrR family transcriptional regulator [Sneathiella sp.]
MTSHTNKRTYSRLPKEQREKDILEAARLEFCKNGYDGAMISAIAAKAGVVEGTIYKYFHNKRDLLVRVIEKWYEGMVKDNTDRIKGLVGTRRRLHQVILQHLSAIHAEPDLCRLVF